ncbi:MAG: cysteine--tRNA ligase [Acidobacteria bacterium]|nr:cysteine--tRNA ligase [Acidobacteriota bacterium]
MTTPSFHNTLGRRQEPLETLQPGKVKLYTCGPTVYDHAHIGNLRTFVFEDILRRSLRYLGYEVYQVMNITDVDDKTIARAREQQLSLADYTRPFTESFFEDLRTLHIEPAEQYPRATEHVPEMIALVERLVEKGYAYESEGSIFFRIAQDEDYGRLSGFDLDQVRQGDRVVDDEYSKEDPRDFVLWKGAKPGEPHWDSPWGPGRPGWHLECSAMSMKYLGETFDIHCGGVDNIFPHHENEIAQSESATGKPFARHFLHAEHLIVDGEKMSKSRGNFYTLKDLLEHPTKPAEPRALRYALLSVHYRKKLNFTLAGLDDAEAALRRVDQMRFALEHATEKEAVAVDLRVDRGGGALRPAVERLENDFAAALADDLNVSKALATVFDFVRTVNKVIESGSLENGDKARVLAALASVDDVLGVLDPADWPVNRPPTGPPNGSVDGPPKAPADRPVDAEAETRDNQLSDDDIEALIQARTDARADKNFARADEIRDQLTEQGIVLEDTPQGTRWKRNRGHLS